MEILQQYKTKESKSNLMLIYYHLTHQLNGMCLVTGVETRNKVTALQGTESYF
jgi:hypothetical protein